MIVGTIQPKRKYYLPVMRSSSCKFIFAIKLSRKPNSGDSVVVVNVNNVLFRALKLSDALTEVIISFLSSFVTLNKIS